MKIPPKEKKIRSIVLAGDAISIIKMLQEYVEKYGNTVFIDSIPHTYDTGSDTYIGYFERENYEET